MSHTRTQKVKIKNANPKVLEDAVDMLCKLIPELERVQSIRGYGGSRSSLRKGAIAVKHHNSRYGQQIYLNEKGEIVISGESMDYETTKFLTSQLKQMYKTKATQMSLKKMGYKTQTQYDHEKKKIKILAMRG